MANKSIMIEANAPAKFEAATVGKSGAILGKLQAPFFDLNNATRNGRFYGEAAEDALQSDEFKEKIETRTFFGRLGHPMTEDEMKEDPAVRAAVILTDYRKNPKTNMYEGTLEILNNDYGKQLKSLIDAGSVMGVSTRGSGDSYESAEGEVIQKGTYEFEALDVVTLPAVKAARCSVMESVDKSKRQKLEDLIESSSDKYVLESLKVTVEASELPNKKRLLESIDKKLSGGVETIESLVNDITELTKRLTEATHRAEKAEKTLNESKSATGTTEHDPKSVSESLLRTANKVIESQKQALARKDKLIESLTSAGKSATAMIESLKLEVETLGCAVESLTVDNRGLSIANGKLKENLGKKNELDKTHTLIRTEKLEQLMKDAARSKTLTESTSKSNSKVIQLTESVKAKDAKITQLESEKKRMTEEFSTERKALLGDLGSYRIKYLESTARAYGIRLDELKAKVTSKSTIAMIESAAKSIRESDDARLMAIPKVESFGKPVESSKISFSDPELDRAGRIAAATSGSK